MAGKSEGGILTVLPDNPFARHSFFCEGGTRSNYPTVPHSTRFDTRFFLIIQPYPSCFLQRRLYSTQAFVKASCTYPPSLLPAIALATAGRLRRVNLTILPLVRKRFQCLEYARHLFSTYFLPVCMLPANGRGAIL